MKNKTHVTTCMAFWDKTTAFADEGRAGDVIYLDFIEGFNRFLEYFCSHVRVLLSG